MDIFTARLDGTGIQQVTRTSTISEREPDWSPGGDKIAYSASVNNAPTDIYTVPASGGAASKITTRAYAYEPEWSPEGKKIAFNGSANEIYAVPAQGGSPTARCLLHGPETPLTRRMVQR
jgi:TolB protein